MTGGTCTMVHVHFRETPYGLAMSLVESRRENGKVRHEHLASLGSIETPPSVAARIEFWRRLHERLDCMSSEHFGQLAWQFKRMSGSSGLKVQAAIAC